MDTTVAIALISFGGAVLGSGGITAIVNHILSHRGKTAHQLDKIEQDLKNLDEKVDKNQALQARNQILRFADEMYANQRHTKEHFDEILTAATAYNQYCDEHPEFENMRTISAQRRITDVYYKCLAEHSFLDSE